MKDYSKIISAKLKTLTAAEIPDTTQEEEDIQGIPGKEEVQEEELHSKVPPGDTSKLKPPPPEIDNFPYREVVNDVRASVVKLQSQLDDFERSAPPEIYDIVADSFSSLRENLEEIVKNPEQFIQEADYSQYKIDNKTT